MKKGLYFLVIVLLLGCDSKTIYPKPKDLIPKDTMSLLIKDLLLANAAKNIKNKNLQRKINYHPLVFEKFKIDSIRYHASNFYYISRVDDYENVLEDVIFQIEAEQKIYIKEKKIQRLNI